MTIENEDDLGSHGIGKRLDEDPDFIANFKDPDNHRYLKEGQVSTLKLFLSTISEETTTADDGWTLSDLAGNCSAQDEHTMISTRDKPIILTAL